MARRLRRSPASLTGRRDHSGDAPSVNYTPAAALTIPTYDGSGLCTEPSVLFFPAGWNGKKYWMGFVPLPDAAHENPSIVVSDDGINWNVPAGLTNPVIAARGSGNNADPELIYNPADSKIYMFYVVQDVAGTGGVYVTSSADGVTWAASVKVLASPDGSGNDMLEPAVVWNGSQYLMFTVNLSTGTLQRRTSSALASGWSSATSCTLSIPGNPGIWHQSCYREPTGRIIVAFCDGATNRSAWLASSWDDGLTFKCASRAFMTKPVSGFGSAAGLYRPTVQPGGAGRYNVWVAGNQPGQAIAYASVPASEVP